VTSFQSGVVTTHVPTRRDHGSEAAADRLPLAHLAGIRVAAVLWGGLALSDAVRLAGAPSYAGVGALGLLVAAASVGMGTGTALCNGTVGWLLATGFVIHRFGVLAYDGPDDLLRLALLVGTSIAATRVHR
jgi:hypothetical protein